MKQTNYYLFDFLDFNTDLNGEDILWRACEPTNIEVQGTDVLVTIPFQKQQCSNDIRPDASVKRKEYKLRLRAYGEKILRVSIGFDIPDMPDSPMLELSPDLEVTPLKFIKSKNEWLVIDPKTNKKVSFGI